MIHVVSKGFREINKDADSTHSFVKTVSDTVNKFDGGHIGGVVGSETILAIKKDIKAKEEFKRSNCHLDRVTGMGN